jgi:hypothetical protein
VRKDGLQQDDVEGLGLKRERIVFGTVRTLRIVGEALYINMRKAEIWVPGADVFLTPSDRWLMNVYPVITPTFIEVVLEEESHQPASASHIQQALLRLKASKQLEVSHELAAGGFECAERANVPAQVQRGEIRLSIDYTTKVIERQETQISVVPERPEDVDGLARQ